MLTNRQLGWAALAILHGFCGRVGVAQIQPKSIVPVEVSRRVALVIGNSKYKSEYFGPIPAASYDADDMASALRGIGFDVTLKKDLAGEALISEVSAFARSKVRTGDLAVFYYSGHGGSVGEENYLLPIGYDPPSDPALIEARGAYAVSKIRNALENAHARVRLLIFDACRSSPLLARAKGGEDGPPKVHGGPEGTIIAFASAHEKEAWFDASQRNSIFTGLLLTSLKQSRLDLRYMMLDVQAQVYQKTSGAQQPDVDGFLSGPLFLTQDETRAHAGSMDPAAEAWTLIKESKDPADFDSFNAHFPRSGLAQTAEMRAEQLRRAAGTSVARLNPPKPAHARSKKVDAESLYEQALALTSRKDYNAAFPLLRQAAKEGNASAMYMVGYAFQFGRGVGINYGESMAWYRRAVDGGVTAAMYEIGYLYHYGQGYGVDYSEAMSWYRKAADAGIAQAFGGIGKLYEGGQGVHKDVTQAASWYRKGAEEGDIFSKERLNALEPPKSAQEATRNIDAEAVYQDALRLYNLNDYRGALPRFRQAADAGHPAATYQIGYLFDKGKGVEKDYSEAMAWYRKASDRGDARAASQIGFYYQHGFGVQIDYAEAMRWYRQASDAGNASGMNQIGYLYHFGLGVPVDFVEAMRWYRKAADGGNAASMNQIGFLYQNGQGVLVDYAEAMRWYRKSSDKGDITAMNAIGILYQNGYGVGIDYVEAMNWYRKAADGGNTAAMYGVGGLYREGHGVEVDYTRAILWFLKAADLGNASADARLGLMYEQGQGLPKDLEQAVTWYRKGAERGDAVSKDRLKALGR